ncbi:MAG: hypothetical protein FJ276_00570 [Planctomycetes bacterium]|nr:hypothetical protein [Planctomycetota bacterium]
MVVVWGAVRDGATADFPGGGELPGGELPGGKLPGGKLPGGKLPGGELPGGRRGAAAGTAVGCRPVRWPLAVFRCRGQAAFRLSVESSEYTVSWHAISLRDERF